MVAFYEHLCVGGFAIAVILFFLGMMWMMDRKRANIFRALPREKAEQRVGITCTCTRKNLSIRDWRKQNSELSPRVLLLLLPIFSLYLNCVCVRTAAERIVSTHANWRECSLSLFFCISLYISKKLFSPFDRWEFRLQRPSAVKVSFKIE